MTIKTGLGQDSHAFEDVTGKPLILAGIKFDYPLGLKGNSDADVVFHSITNAISSITGRNILGSVADKLAEQGQIDSQNYLKIALDDLNAWKINHIAISIECLKPKISPQIELMRNNISKLCNIHTADVGITATTGEGLTAFGRGEGIQVISLVTVSKS